MFRGGLSSLPLLMQAPFPTHKPPITKPDIVAIRNMRHRRASRGTVKFSSASFGCQLSSGGLRSSGLV